jgi:hypothetical protein
MCLGFVGFIVDNEDDPAVKILDAVTGNAAENAKQRVPSVSRIHVERQEPLLGEAGKPSRHEQDDRSEERTMSRSVVASLVAVCLLTCR